MKKLLSILTVSAILTSVSCKKDETKADVINVSTAHKAFLIEYSWTGCPPCGTYGYPAFHDVMQLYPYDLTMINMHNSWGGSTPGFSEIKTFYSFSGTPHSAANSGTKIEDMYPSKSAFQSYAVNAKSIKAKAGVGISKTLTGNKLDIKTKTVFFEGATGSYNLAIYIVENGIMSTQSGYSSSDPIPHDNVYRGEANGKGFGRNIVSNPSAGQVIDGTYSFTLSGAIKPANVQVVAVIWKIDQDGKPVEMLNSNKE